MGFFMCVEKGDCLVFLFVSISDVRYIMLLMIWMVLFIDEVWKFMFFIFKNRFFVVMGFLILLKLSFLICCEFWGICFDLIRMVVWVLVGVVLLFCCCVIVGG